MATQLQAWFPWTARPLVVSAPMRAVSGAALAAAVSNAAGLGFVGAGYSLDNDDVMADLAHTPGLLLSGPAFTEPARATPAAFGIGFILFHCPLDQALAATASLRPAAVWLFAPASDGQLREWVSMLRAVAPWTKVAVQVCSIAAATHALQITVDGGECGVHMLVAQGVPDAGGHGECRGASLMALVPELQDLLGRLGQRGRVPVLAAGGIMDGRGAAAALALGADGVVLGTRVSAVLYRLWRGIAESGGGRSWWRATRVSHRQGCRNCCSIRATAGSTLSGTRPAPPPLLCWSWW